MRILCHFIVLLVYFVVVFVHVFHVDGVGRLAGYFVLSFALVRINYRWLKLVRVVPVRWHVLLRWVDEWETLLYMVRHLLLDKICLSI